MSLTNHRLHIINDSHFAFTSVTRDRFNAILLYTMVSFYGLSMERIALKQMLQLYLIFCQICKNKSIGYYFQLFIVRFHVPSHTEEFIFQFLQSISKFTRGLQSKTKDLQTNDSIITWIIESFHYSSGLSKTGDCP